MARCSVSSGKLSRNSPEPVLCSHCSSSPGSPDVLVNGPDSVWVDRGAGLERTTIRFTDEAAVRSLAQRLAALAGRRLDDASPYVDAALPDGTRLHAVLPPIAPTGTCLSLRTFTARAFTIATSRRPAPCATGPGCCFGRSSARGRRSWSAVAPEAARPPC